MNLQLAPNTRCPQQGSDGIGVDLLRGFPWPQKVRFVFPIDSGKWPSLQKETSLGSWKGHHFPLGVFPVDGRNPKTSQKVPCFIGFYTSQVVQDFFSISSMILKTQWIPPWLEFHNHCWGPCRVACLCLRLACENITGQNQALAWIEILSWYMPRKIGERERDEKINRGWFFIALLDDLSEVDFWSTFDRPKTSTSTDTREARRRLLRSCCGKRPVWRCLDEGMAGWLLKPLTSNPAGG